MRKQIAYENSGISAFPEHIRDFLDEPYADKRKIPYEDYLCKPRIRDNSADKKDLTEKLKGGK